MTDNDEKSPGEEELFCCLTKVKFFQIYTQDVKPHTDL